MSCRCGGEGKAGAVIMSLGEGEGGGEMGGRLEIREERGGWFCHGGMRISKKRWCPSVLGKEASFEGEGGES